MTNITLQYKLEKTKLPSSPPAHSAEREQKERKTTVMYASDANDFEVAIMQYRVVIVISRKYKSY